MLKQQDNPTQQTPANNSSNNSNINPHLHLHHRMTFAHASTGRSSRRPRLARLHHRHSRVRLRTGLIHI